MEVNRIFTFIKSLILNESKSILTFFSILSISIGLILLLESKGSILLNTVGNVFYWGIVFLVSGILSLFTTRNFYLHYMLQSVPYQIYTGNLTSAFGKCGGADALILMIFIVLTIGTVYFSSTLVKTKINLSFEIKKDDFRTMVE